MHMDDAEVLAAQARILLANPRIPRMLLFEERPIDRAALAGTKAHLGVYSLQLTARGGLAWKHVTRPTWLVFLGDRWVIQPESALGTPSGYLQLNDPDCLPTVSAEPWLWWDGSAWARRPGLRSVEVTGPTPPPPPPPPPPPAAAPADAPAAPAPAPAPAAPAPAPASHGGAKPRGGGLPVLLSRQSTLSARWGACRGHGAAYCAVGSCGLMLLALVYAMANASPVTWSNPFDDRAPPSAPSPPSLPGACDNKCLLRTCYDYAPVLTCAASAALGANSAPEDGQCDCAGCCSDDLPPRAPPAPPPAPPSPPPAPLPSLPPAPLAPPPAQPPPPRSPPPPNSPPPPPPPLAPPPPPPDACSHGCLLLTCHEYRPLLSCAQTARIGCDCDGCCAAADSAPTSHTAAMLAREPRAEPRAGGHVGGYAVVPIVAVAVVIALVGSARRWSALPRGRAML